MTNIKQLSEEMAEEFSNNSKKITDIECPRNIKNAELQQRVEEMEERNAELEDHTMPLESWQEINSQLKEAVGVIKKFVTKSNGLSIYCRDEYQKTRLEMTDSVDLVERLETLYAHQCEAESFLAKLKGGG